MWLSASEDPLRRLEPTFLYTGVVLRGIAYSLDTLLFVGYELALVFSGVSTAVPPAFLGILVVAGPALYFVVGWADFGTTVGMRLLHLTIVREVNGQPEQDGDSLGYQRAFVRFVALVIVSSIVPVLLVVLPIVFDAQRRGIHDRVAGTVVIRPARRRPALAQTELAATSH